jgi:hypothetical protein
VHCREKQALVQEVIHQIRYFVPEAKVIKQRIEAMINQDYIKRLDVENVSSPYM